VGPPGHPGGLGISVRKKYSAHPLHFSEECDALAHEHIFFNFWRFLSRPSRKSSYFGPAGTKLRWTWRNVTIRLGLKHVFFLSVSDLSLISEAWSGWAKTTLKTVPNRFQLNLPFSLRTVRSYKMARMVKVKWWSGRRPTSGWPSHTIATTMRPFPPRFPVATVVNAPRCQKHTPSPFAVLACVCFLRKFLSLCSMFTMCCRHLFWR